ncbi:excinuclease Cho [Erwinia piriflorinigrans]|uniref:Excinuclease cho n=1 Tax=Erwinia piriflorinigrans CFBP 5888 TaxID=1161919 RepID=V5Z7X3_9GAMM|nr:excinuclease Cho [Erwinia piriflorinigrans]CCG87141.1 putative excinuclease cho [Erwinia piriflorinigrans CFBP 5888]
MVRKPVSPRIEFDAAAIYQYPEQLRPCLEALPKLPGVYVFHGESETMPLYIGKSVNIRSRVLSHLRTADEARMLRQATRISFIPTAGELGALLLEAQMIKLQQPLFNKRLRKNRQLCSLQITAGTPQVVYAKDVDFSSTAGLYGLYANRRAALETLQKIADEQRLCYHLLGLEKLRSGSACFRFALKRCAGACCGKETEDEHQQRLVSALEAVRLQCWPWPDAVAVLEQRAGQTQYHIINNWLYLGSVSQLEEAKSLCSTTPGFDSDGYKILCKPMLTGKLPVMLVPKA